MTGLRLCRIEAFLSLNSSGGDGYDWEGYCKITVPRAEYMRLNCHDDC